MVFSHKPVLMRECIDGLNIKPTGVYVDGTLGGAGHSTEILKKLGKGGTLIGIDQDIDAINAAKSKLSKIATEANWIFEHTNFCNIKEVCEKNKIDKIDGVLLDLGVSSYQLDTAERGFSYNHDASLDMRMDKRSMFTAEALVNEYSKDELKRVIWSYGEEKWADRIAQFIEKARREKRIQTTGELVDIIKAAIPSKCRREGPHPAKRTFQAIRIEVNKELEVLASGLKEIISVLNKGGRLCVITFHSLEDKIVKKTMAVESTGCKCPPTFPVCVCNEKPNMKLITKKAIEPSEIEVDDNPRARSSKLRIAERI